ncbi:MAG: hypothetical protein F6K56_23095 [Moorea sp. SIO3G5]|nr:hypothetical protein [Moorena sp. SIO3G5]
MESSLMLTINNQPWPFSHAIAESGTSSIAFNLNPWPFSHAFAESGTSSIAFNLQHQTFNIKPSTFNLQHFNLQHFNLQPQPFTIT